MPRPIYLIADDICADWGGQGPGGVYYAARPYLGAMRSIASIDQAYGYDNAKNIVRYFLSNAATYRGPKAKALKAELRGLLGDRA
jgi:hypothetical protein